MSLIEVLSYTCFFGVIGTLVAIRSIIMILNTVTAFKAGLKDK